MGLSVIILAAGSGTRMRSALPKVLHTVAARPLLGHVIASAQALAPQEIVVVYGHGGDVVRQALASAPVAWAEQKERLGTGHAVAQALPMINDAQIALVLYGDVPLITPETLRRLVRSAQSGDFALLTAYLRDPHGYGRIIRDEAGRVRAIVEEKDASPEQRRVNEVNTGFMAVSAKRLRQWLGRIDNKNAQGEYYLTDAIGLAASDGVTIQTSHPDTEDEILGVNNRVQLADLERRYQRRAAERLMLAGVTLRDPSRFDVRGEVIAGTDVTIDVNVLCEGRVELGSRVSIGPNCVLRNVRIADDVEIFANSVVEDAVIGAHARIGPFSRIRPETEVGEHAHIGNFVEVKKSLIGPHSKVNHLSYVGDTTMGADVNIGAGTITCNYDGAQKHRTVIGDGVFVGSDTQLVAPVTVGNQATIAAGTTVTKDVPEGVLCISRVPQQVKTGWRRPQKKAKPPQSD